MSIMMQNSFYLFWDGRCLWFSPILITQHSSQCKLKNKYLWDQWRHAI